MLTSSKDLIEYFESVCQYSTNYKTIANFLIGPLQNISKEQLLTLKDLEIKPKSLAELVDMVHDNLVSFSVASQILLHQIIENPMKSPMQLAKEGNLLQEIFDENIVSLEIYNVLNEYSTKVLEYKSGKLGLFDLFVGQVIRRTKNKYSPDKIRNLIKKVIDSYKTQ